jgi:signal peptidase II
MNKQNLHKIFTHPFTYIIIGIIFLDQVLKFLARQIAPYRLFPFLSIAKAQNTGVAFGMLKNIGSANLIFLVVSLLAICFMSYLFFSDQLGRKSRIGLTMMIGGALANSIDRVIHGFVIDFIDFHIGSWHFATFNIADAAISIGALIVIFFLFIEEKEMAIETFGASQKKSGKNKSKLHSSKPHAHSLDKKPVKKSAHKQVKKKRLKK